MQLYGKEKNKGSGWFDELNPWYLRCKKYQLKKKARQEAKLEIKKQT